MLSSILKESSELIDALRKHLTSHDENRVLIQEELTEGCKKLREAVDELENRVNEALQSVYKEEDERVQAIVGEINARVCDAENSGNKARERLEEAIKRGRAELLVKQSYALKPGGPEIPNAYKLVATKGVAEEYLSLQKPSAPLEVTMAHGEMLLTFQASLTLEEEEALERHGLADAVEYVISIRDVKDKKSKWEERRLTRKTKAKTPAAVGERPRWTFSFVPSVKSESEYEVRVKSVFGGLASEWSDTGRFVTPGFEECCVWKECPEDVPEELQYTLDKENPRIARKVMDEEYYGNYCTIVGSIALQGNKVSQWNVKVLKTKDHESGGICIGVAPFDVDQKMDRNFMENGWYIDCGVAELLSGPPHNSMGTEYGPRKNVGEYVHEGDTVGVVMDTTKGELSFVLGGTSYGPAYEGIPLDKPLVPCVILNWAEDTVELLFNAQ